MLDQCPCGNKLGDMCISSQCYLDKALTKWLEQARVNAVQEYVKHRKLRWSFRRFLKEVMEEIK